MEPATSARSEPAPSAMAVSNKTPATCFATPSFVFAEPALAADAFAADLKVALMMQPATNQSRPATG